ncbi:hypothetical protein ACIQUQ_15015 [Streptomyces sp. NPDC101118]|uniref:hypothetical protein n=1 Tax=Streptomyces sp. NPDC101118 TaxID=3366109 RepID=UPI0037F441C7
MMFGGGDGWQVLVFLPPLLWFLGGPFIMLATGVWCARRPGWKPRLWSVLLPAEPVLALLVVFLVRLQDPDSRWWDDFSGYLLWYVGVITALPWLLGWGITRIVGAVRAPRARRLAELAALEAEEAAAAGPGGGTAGAGPAEKAAE